MLGELVPCAGGAPIALRKPRLLLGRHADCDVSLPFSTVSSRHCQLELRDGYWLVRDLKSSNGTRVNGTVCESQWLLPNDVLALAKYRYGIVYTPPSGRLPPQGIASPPGATGSPGPEARIEAAKPATLPVQQHGASGFGLGELVPCGGGDPIPLLKSKLIVGRHETCDIVLRSGTVSGRHCELEWTDGAWVVRDLGSRHGIRVDGEPCQSQRMAPGSILSITNQRFRIVYTPPGAGGMAARGPMFAQSLLEAAGLARWQPPSGGRTKPGDEDEPRRKYTLDDA